MSTETATAPDGSEVSLVGVGTSVLLETPHVRVWDVVLPAGGMHPWHLHHNPYVVLSVAGSTGYMEWLDGSPRRDITEYSGGAVFRPVSPVHRLTNSGSTRYRNRLVELKALGEDRPGGPLDVGPGLRSTQADTAGPVLPDGRVPVLIGEFVKIWLLTVPAGEVATLQLDHGEYVLAELDADLDGEDLAASVSQVSGPWPVANPGTHERRWFVVGLDYLEDR
ncbi:MAG: hypothetical protein ACK5H2_09015 [Beutenbergiaceae bacterium]